MVLDFESLIFLSRSTMAFNTFPLFSFFLSSSFISLSIFFFSSGDKESIFNRSSCKDCSFLLLLYPLFLVIWYKTKNKSDIFNSSSKAFVLKKYGLKLLFNNKSISDCDKYPFSINIFFIFSCLCFFLRNIRLEDLLSLLILFKESPVLGVSAVSNIRTPTSSIRFLSLFIIDHPTEAIPMSRPNIYESFI